MKFGRSFTIWASLAVLVPFATGCSKDGDGDGSGSGSGSDNGEETGGETGGDGDVGAWEMGPIYGVANWDNDDENGQLDWVQLPFEGDDDLSAFIFPQEMLDRLGASDSIRLTLTGDVNGVRMWHTSGGAPLMGADTGPEPVTTVTLTPDQHAGLLVEFGDYLVQAIVTVDRVSEAGEVLDSVDVAVTGAPLILNHHLQTAEEYWVVSVNFGGGSNNASMIMDYEALLGDAFTSVPGNPYGGDVWIQDEIELATQQGADGMRQDVIIDSIRDRGLDNFAEDIQGPLYAVGTWGQPGTENSCDSFGNMEITPPLSANGVDYPFGRIYYGDGGPGCDVAPELQDLLARQKVQAPFVADTSWLCVGHVDEWATFIPDPDSEKGFKLLYSDTASAWEILAEMDPATALPRFETTHNFATVGDILNDEELRTRNDGVQANYLDPILEQYKQEFGLVDDDIILVPSLFERCGGAAYNVALIPGTPNLVVANEEGQGPRLIVPDPFVRTDETDQASDPFIADFIERMPPAYGAEGIVFTDNWTVYHANLGEVHCGTNVRRTPDPTLWWESATHLID